MAKYYTRITLKRMSQLLDLSVDVSLNLQLNYYASKFVQNHLQLIKKKLKMRGAALQTKFLRLTECK